MTDTTATLFGTDGIRGRAGQTPLTPHDLTRLAGAILSAHHDEHGRLPRRIVIGRDPRISSPMIASALASGFLAGGVDCTALGILPTPAVAQRARVDDMVDLGIMVTASHNPYPDNGIKIFDGKGHKLNDDQQLAIEQIFYSADNIELAAADVIGRLSTDYDRAVPVYLKHVQDSVSAPLELSDFKIVVDSANGALSGMAQGFFDDLGAQVIAIGHQPDGKNINDGVGATHPDACRQAVMEENADIGFAFDGDGDRITVIDDAGKIIDGDQIIAFLAKRLQNKKRLVKDQLVTTVMSNLGLEEKLGELGIKLHRTPVGDRAVSAQMTAHGLSLGGEQSGHIILADHATTGDGLLAAYQIMAALIAKGARAQDAFDLFDPVPQKLENVEYELGAGNPLDDPSVQETIEAVEADLGENGRVLVRKSGTEPVIRVMVEARDESVLLDGVNRICQAITDIQSTDNQQTGT